MEMRLASVLLMLVACGPRLPRFGSLEPDARALKVETTIRVLELSNGMQVALAPDPRTNLVSVDMRYHVGAAQDPVDKVGLAHFVEHATFLFPSGGNGATIWDRMTGLALWQNAATSWDYTHYMSTALAERVDALLELEAQRLQARCETLDDKQVVRERDVVLAEEAQRRTEVTDVQAELGIAVWGVGHPYARPLTSRDMAHATKRDVCAFFDAYYVPKRATLVVTGNFDPDVLQERIARRFAPIQREAKGTSAEPRPPRLEGTKTTHVAQVDHAVAQIYLPAPRWGAPEEALHDMVMTALRTDLAGLAREGGIAETDVSYGGGGAQRTTVITIAVADPARLERAVEQVFATGRDLFEDEDRDGGAGDRDDADDLRVLRWIDQLRGRLQTITVMRADQIQWRGMWLGDFLQYTTHHNFQLEHMRAVDAITPQALVAYTKTLFDPQRSHVGLIRPSGDATSSAKAFHPVDGSASDLAPWRLEVDPREATRPLPMPRNARPIEIEEYGLTNGMRVLLFLDPSSPIIDARVVYPVGTIDDAPGRPGVAAFAGELLGHDAEREYDARTADTLNWAFNIGTVLWSDVGDATTVFHARGLGIFGDWHVWRLSWLLDLGTYADRTIDAERKKLRAQGDDDDTAADTAFRARLFGAGHPYAAPPPTVAQRSSIGAGELAAWRKQHFTTDGATLIVSGGFDREQMRKTIAELYGPWSKTATRAPREVPSPAPQPGWIGVRVANAPQVALRVGFASRAPLDEDRAARLVLAEMVNDRLSRVREGQGASYGVYTRYVGGAGGTAIEIETALEVKRAPVIAKQIVAELAALRGGVAKHASDFARARRRVFTRLLASSRDATSVANELQFLAEHGLRPAQLQGLTAEVANLTPAAVAEVAEADLDPARMTVAVRGDGQAAGATLSALGATAPDWFDE